MAIRISPARLAIAPGVSFSFGASGGTEPYSYSASGPGSISADGVYTAPAILPSIKDQPTIIEAKDSLGHVSDAEVHVLSALGLFCDVIQQELGLEDGRVFVWDQKINMPTDMGMFVAVGVVNCKPYSNIRKMKDDGSTFQQTNFMVDLDVSVISRGPEARDRKEEVLMALNSFYSEQQQSMNGFRIYPITSTFTNISEVDGAAIPYRFVLGCRMAYAVKKETDSAFYDTFLDPEILID